MKKLPTFHFSRSLSTTFQSNNSDNPGPRQCPGVELYYEGGATSHFQSSTHSSSQPIRRFQSPHQPISDSVTDLMPLPHLSLGMFCHPSYLDPTWPGRDGGKTCNLLTLLPCAAELECSSKLRNLMMHFSWCPGLSDVRPAKLQSNIPNS